jgi:hypothetical protein
MKHIPFVILISMFLQTGCKSSKPEGTAPSREPVAKEAASPPPVTVTNDDGTPVVDEIYRVIVSFISIGEGTDSRAREQLDAFITDWKGRKQMELEIVEIPWGREGEVDFCFPLKELSPEEQAIFVEEIKTVFLENNLIQIAENQKGRFSK